jgi:hypothetical protein
MMGMENESTKVTVRIDLGIEDSKREGENTAEAFDRVYNFVESKLSEKVQEASAELEAK